MSDKKLFRIKYTGKPSHLIEMASKAGTKIPPSFRTILSAENEEAVREFFTQKYPMAIIETITELKDTDGDNSNSGK